MTLTVQQPGDPSWVAPGPGQLEKFDRILELRAAAARRYDDLLDNLGGIEGPSQDDAEHRRSWFVYVVRLDPDLDRDAVMAALRREGVATGLIGITGPGRTLWQT